MIDGYIYIYKPCTRDGEDQILRFKGFISFICKKNVQNLFHQRTWRHRTWHLEQNSGPENCPQGIFCKRRCSPSCVMHGGTSHVDQSRCVITNRTSQLSFLVFRESHQCVLRKSVRKDKLCLARSRSVIWHSLTLLYILSDSFSRWV